jgi:DNA adenine methylase
LTETNPEAPAAPFLKWAGGKGQILSYLLPMVPEGFGTYHEPFIGGGALFFALVSRGLVTKAVLGDLNEELMTTYRAVRNRHRLLTEALRRMEERYLSEQSQSKFYYTVRESRPVSTVNLAARFVFLNKTCYNGLYRVNRLGKFNVPFGRYTKPRICDENGLGNASKALKRAQLVRGPFEKALAEAREGDFVYLDPPYQPLNKTSNFTSYTSNGFAFEDQQRLAREFARLDRLGVFVMLSNSDHYLISQLYGKSNYCIEEVKANRAINCNARGRGPVSELVVRNYA